MDAPEIDVTQAKQQLEEKAATFVDVRDLGAFQSGHIPGAVHIHDRNVEQFLAEAAKDRPVIIYCYRGNTSKGAVKHFLEQGIETVHNLTGGWESWQEVKGPVEKSETSAGSATLAITELARTKLQEYLSSEPAGTAVRIVLEPHGAFGLSLDGKAPGDVVLDVDGVPVVMEMRVAPSARGLKIDFLDKANGAGFQLSGGNPPGRASKGDMLEEIKGLIDKNKVMLFMKGTAMQPMCGFSARTVQALQSTGHPFGDKNVLEVAEYRYALSEHSSWPTIPQVFIDGKFVGGCDIVLEMQSSGELQKLVDEAFAAKQA